MMQWSEFSRSEKLDGINVSEIIRIGIEANKLVASGQDIIFLNAGEPDFPTPDNVKMAGIKAIIDNQTRYTALDGIPALKEAIRQKFLRENNLDYKISEISVGPGAKQLLFNVFMATLNQGDEVVVPMPCWTSYFDIIRIAGGVPVAVQCSVEEGFRMTAEQLRAAITPKTRWLLLNSPSNPTGTVYGKEHLEALGDVLRQNPHVGIVSDDIYEHITYGGTPFVSMAHACPDLKPRVVTVNGVSKAYSMTGWRIGYAGASAEIVAAMAVVQSQSSSNPCSISQVAAVEALNGTQDNIAVRRDVFQRRRDLSVAALNDIPGISCCAPEGAFYAFADIRELVANPEVIKKQVRNDKELCHYFLHACGVAVVPGSRFGGEGFIRLSYATSDKALGAAFERMKNGVLRLIGHQE
ncbi:MAG: pyridoxal phosphate-dependent aminotransferase [Acetobacter okinawensis]|uniref:pyridoxal phosphate-dependent aminotransferase n=1 Tax=Acetobacter okinawensis TaxID=1076594 RepID=UPI0039E9D1DB